MAQRYAQGEQLHFFTTAGSPARARASFEEAKPGAAFDPVLGWLSGL